MVLDKNITRKEQLKKLRKDTFGNKKNFEKSMKYFVEEINYRIETLKWLKKQIKKEKW